MHATTTYHPVIDLRSVQHLNEYLETNPPIIDVNFWGIKLINMSSTSIPLSNFINLITRITKRTFVDMESGFVDEETRVGLIEKIRGYLIVGNEITYQKNFLTIILANAYSQQELDSFEDMKKALGDLEDHTSHE